MNSESSTTTQRLSSGEQALLSKGRSISDDIIRKYQRVLNTLADILHVPAALIMKVDQPYIEVFIASESEGNPYKPGERERLDGLYCERVITSQERLLVENALINPEWRENPDIKLGMVSYLGFPVNWPDGEIFGTICVLDKQHNSYGESYIRLVEQFRDMINTDLALLGRSAELEQKRDEIAELRKLLPICPACGIPRGGEEYRQAVMRYVSEHMKHSEEHACRECGR